MSEENCALACERNDKGHCTQWARPHSCQRWRDSKEGRAVYDKALADGYPPLKVADTTPQPPTVYDRIAAEIGALVTEKNAAYGPFSACSEHLRLLWPNGINPSQYDDVLCVVRMLDKIRRIATDKGALGESPYSDIAGYAILGVAKDSR